MYECKNCGQLIVSETDELVIGADYLLTIYLSGQEIHSGGNYDGDNLAFCDVGCFETWLREERVIKKSKLEKI